MLFIPEVKNKKAIVKIKYKRWPSSLVFLEQITEIDIRICCIHKYIYNKINHLYVFLMEAEDFGLFHDMKVHVS